MRNLLRRILVILSANSLFYRILEKAYSVGVSSRFSNLDPRDLIQLKHLIEKNIYGMSPGLKRVGSENDGGYVIWPHISKNTELLSFGIGDNVDFEEQMSALVKRIHAFDGSIDLLPRLVPKLEFHQLFVSSAKTTNSIDISEILSGISCPILILKIDIEGSEWDVLDQISEAELRRFDQIVGEFHGLTSSTKGFDLKRKIEILEKIHSNFYLTNSHPNNWSHFNIVHGVPIPDVVELSFVRKDLPSTFHKIPSRELRENQELNLNRPCNPKKPDYII